MGVSLGLCTCGGSQLQRGLCVVLHPVLQGPLHVGFGIQQQLQRSGGDVEGHDGREREEGEERRKSQFANENDQKSASLIW